MKLRPYQNEILELMNKKEKGKYLVQLATGLGKTIVFTSYINQTYKRVLILSHREELVHQVIKYINRKCGIENGTNHSNGEPVISASVQSIIRRLNKFPKDYFNVIITDECHHSPALSYQKIYNHFNFDLHFGFTATPNRADNVRLDKTFDEIIYEKDLVWGIKKNYLSNIKCKRFYINYNLSGLKTSSGDYQLLQLEQAVNTDENAAAIAKIYKNHAVGRTLIFAVSVSHCEEIQKHIPGSVVINAITKNRHEIIDNFTLGKVKCIINCMIFTEGTDIPLIETIIIARPTKNISLYCQMVGRGLRLALNKPHLTLIDCCGITNNNLVTAPSLLGLEVIEPKEKTAMTRDKLIEGDLFDLEDNITIKQYHPDYWKINWKIVKLFEKKHNFNLHDINFTKMPNGDLLLKTKTINVRIKAPDVLGTGFQDEIETLYKWLIDKKMDEVQLWDLTRVKRWGRKPASQKQKDLVNNFLPKYDTSQLNMMEASQILNRLMGGS